MATIPPVMPQPPPLPDWTGQPAYLLGGGKSLTGFDFTQLQNCNVIGCNQAFLTQPDIIDIVVFGDPGFWKRHCIDLAAFLGHVATNRTDLHTFGPLPKWLKIYKRIDTGLGEGETLAFNYNTGALAINLAITLGAGPIYLLGYDCHTTGHWHGKAYEVAQPSHYSRFIEGFESLEVAHRLIRPSQKMLNVCEQNSSKLGVFPIVPFSSAYLVAPNPEVSHASLAPA